MMNAKEAIKSAINENIDSYEGGIHQSVPAFRAEWHPGHRSSRMSMNRNLRRKRFGYTDAPSSLRDRGWPYANRGYDRRRAAWEKAVARFGRVRPGGEAI